MHRYDRMGQMYVKNLSDPDDNEDESELPSNATVDNAGVHESNAKVGASTSGSFGAGIADLLEEWEEPELQGEDETVGTCYSLRGSHFF